MTARRIKEPARSGDEQDATSRAWKRWLCVFHNRTGLAKRIKRALNKRLRRALRLEAREDES